MWISFAAVQILELARNAQRLFEAQEPRQKRRLLNFVLSNCTWEDGEVVATFRQPFDLLAETTAIAASYGAVNTAKSSKSEIWLTRQSLANRSPPVTPCFPLLFSEKRPIFPSCGTTSGQDFFKFLSSFPLVMVFPFDTGAAIISPQNRDIFSMFQGRST